MTSTGNPTVPGLTSTANLSVTVPTAFIIITSTTGANSAAIDFVNTGGQATIGSENSAGNALVNSGGVAYGLALISAPTTPILFAPGGDVKAKLDTNGILTFTTAVTKIVPGATSFSIRNNASTFDNLLVLDNGNATLRGNLTFASANTKIAVPGAGSTDFRAASDASSVLLILDTGVVSLSTGKLITFTSTTATAGLRIPHGVAPTAPADGDIWSTTTTLNFRLNGVTKSVTLT